MTFIEELLNAWSQTDRRDISADLGYPRVSPAFRHVVSSDDTEEPFELSREDVQRISLAVAELANHHAAEYEAVCRRFRPWASGSPRPTDDYLLQTAYTRLSKILTGGAHRSQQ